MSSLFGLLALLVVVPSLHGQNLVTDLPSVHVDLVEGTGANHLVHQVDSAYTTSDVSLFFTCSTGREIINNEDYFTIIGNGEEIRTAAVLDRERIVKGTDKPNNHVTISCSYVILLTSTSELFGYPLTIEIHDINDMAPTFTQPYTFYELLENENRPGEFIMATIAMVEDLDEGENGTLTFSITHENYPGLFTLESPTRRGSLYSLRVTSTRPVDREVWPHYTAQVNAFDGGSPSLESILDINITFLDRNDNNPMFPQSRYNITIAEGSEAGTSLLNVSATDADIGSNAALTYQIQRIKYYLLSSQSVLSSTLSYIDIPEDEWSFAINTLSGAITVTKSLDREAYRDRSGDHRPIGFFIEVTASDGPLIGDTFINVVMTDLNDNAPHIRYNALRREVEEDFGIPLRIGVIEVNDPDAGQNGTYSVALQNLDQIGSIFYLDSGQTEISGSGQTDIELYLNTTVDYESANKEYMLVVTAHDNGTLQRQTSSMNITIVVADVNDNGPVFSSPSYQANIKETNTSVFVVELEVTDRDGPLHSTNRLHLPEATAQFPHQHLFRVVSNSYDIYTALPIDREALESPQLTLLVEAFSPEDPPLFSATTTVTVTVEDENDNTPVFDPDQPRTVSVREESGSGTPVLSVTARDGDVAAGSALQYSIVQSGTVPFAVDSAGHVRTARTLDWERDPHSFTFDVRASDGTWDAVLNFTVFLEDINDHAPNFQGISYSKSLPEDDPIGTDISHLVVTDEDSGVASQRLYSFVGGNEEGKFSVLENGTVILVGHLDRETTDSYSLRIVVSDGEFSSANTATVSVTVLDKNDNPPVFSKAVYRFTISENNGTYASLGYVSATSGDLHGNSVVRYSVSNTKQFTINSDGQILTLDSLDRDHNPVEPFYVTGQDGSSSVRLTSSALVVVTILDEDDNGPYFPVSQPPVAVLAENYPRGRVFFTASAADDDEPQNSFHTYTIASQQHQYFAVDERTGGLSLRTSLDYETVQQTSVTVQAEDSQGRSNRLTLTVNVTNVDDNAPTFPDNFPHRLSVVENQVALVPLHRFTAIDLDGPGTITAQLSDISGAGLSEFHISPVAATPNTFDLSTSKSLDRERVAEYALRIRLADSLQLSSTLDVVVMVGDINDNAPLFPDAAYSLSVLENEVAGTPVGTVTAEDADAGDNAVLRYHLQGGMDKFVVDPASGQITTLEPLDREAQDEYSFEVVATDGGQLNTQSSSVRVTVRVEDVNDNHPTFDLTQQFYAQVNEDSPPGSQVVALLTADRDTGSNAHIGYSLLASSTEEEGLFGFHGSNLIVTGPLDYERHTYYLLRVTAQDSGGLSTTRLFNITVSDVNDEAPTITPPAQVVTIREDAEVGARLCSFSASDSDSGNGRVVQFAFGVGNFDSVFAVSSSGVVTLARSLDFEKKPNYTVEVVAENLASPQLIRVAVMTVVVENVNDNAPQFGLTQIIALVVENSEPNEAVITVTATDADHTGSPGDSLTYSIVASQPKGGYFSIEPSGGEITTTRSPDYEDTEEFVLVVQAEDEDGLASTITVVVAVENLNDNAPQFNPPLVHSLQIYEDTQRGHILTTVSAIDPDNATYSAVSFSLHGAGREHFEIDPDTYYLHLVSAVDAEDRALINLTVKVEDTGNPPLFTEQSILITIKDINDHSPVFRESAYMFQVAENSPVGSDVDKVEAVDDDQSDNNVKYSLRAPSQLFSVVPATGTIVTKAEFDFESLQPGQRCSNLEVVATDSSFNPRSSFTSVTVCVTDVNDHPPVFAPSVFYLSVNSVSDVGTQIGRVTATDADQGDNSAVVYSLRGSSLFGIESSMGYVTVAASLEVGTFEVTVTAEDRGFPPLFTSVRVVMSVITASDRPPRFPQTDYTFSVSENTLVSQFVWEVRATDEDSGSNGEIAYSLASNNTAALPLFLISAEGALSPTAPLDYEFLPEYRLQVVAQDGSGRRSTAFVTVQVSDVNDNPPVFASYPNSVQLGTVVGAGYTVLTLAATDLDSGSNGRVQYSLAQPSPYLAVDAGSGDVRTVQALSSGLTFSVTFIATDGGEQDASLTMSFSVIDTDDGPSFGLYSSLVVEVMEDAEVGTIVHTFTATSHIRTDPARVYSLSHRVFPDELFLLNRTTGDLQLNGPLDFEATQQYSFVVGARQQDGAKWLSGYLNVTVQVEDVNDNAPVFEPVSGNLSFVEDLPKNTVLFKVSANDADSGTNSAIRYSIVEQSYGALRIEPSSGSVYIISGGLDAERSNQFSLVVTATDQAIYSRSSTMFISFSVVDVNDNMPRFYQDASVTIQEDSPLNTIVYLSHADDQDPSTDLVYSITRVNAYRGLVLLEGEESVFSIDPSSGRIHLSGALNQEHAGRYVLTVSVTDGLYAHSMLVNVKVGDNNDNPPIFYSEEGGSSTVVVDLDELSPSGTPVLHLTASDADRAANARLTYSLAGGLAAEEMFAVNPETGLVTLAAPLRGYSLSGGSNSIRGAVVATDGGSPARSSSAAVTVNVVDVNNHPPLFQESYADPTQHRVFTDLRSGSEVLVVLAEDDDLGHNAAVEYRMSVADVAVRRMFAVTLEGRVEVSGTLFPGIHNFTVEAWNRRPSPYRPQYISFSSTTVAIQVNRRNRFSPFFSPQALSTEVPENATMGHIFLTLSAFDSDYGVNGEVAYTALEGDSVPFSVSTQSGKGVVAVSGDLDREMRPSYQLTLVATDRGYPPRSDSATLTIMLLDVNDNRPSLTPPTGITVEENSEPRTEVTRLSASDADEGRNSQVEYFLVAPSDGAELPFALHQQSGVLTTTSLIDREKNASFDVTVRMADLGSPPQTADAVFTVLVGDKDESLPRFVQSRYEFTVTSTSNPGTVVGSVKANDDDATAKLTYAFVDNILKGYFELNATSGEIKLIAERREDVSSGSTSQTSLRRRRQTQPDVFQTVEGHVQVTDAQAPRADPITAGISFSVSTVFVPVVGTTPSAPAGIELWVIVVIAASGALVLGAFLFATCVAVCLCCRRRLGSYKVAKESPRMGYSDTFNHCHDDWDHDGKYLDGGSVGGSQIINGGGGAKSASSLKNVNSEPDLTPTKQSRRSYEMTDFYRDSPHKYASRQSSNLGTPVFPGTLASLRSTSDLGSTVGTDCLGSRAMLETSFNQHPVLALSRGGQVLAGHELMQSCHMFDVEGGGESGAVAGEFDKGWMESGDEDSVKGFTTNSQYDLNARSSGLLLMDPDANQWRRSKDSDLFRSQTMDVAVDEMTSGTDEPVWLPPPHPHRRAQSSQGHHPPAHHHHRSNQPYYRQRSTGVDAHVGSLSMLYQGNDGYYQPPPVPYQPRMNAAHSYSQGLNKQRKAASVISEPYYSDRAYQGRTSAQSNHSHYYNHHHRQHHRQHPMYGSHYEHTVPYPSQHTDSLSQPSVSPAEEFSMRPNYGPEPTSHSGSLSSSSISIASTQIELDRHDEPHSTTHH